MIVADLVAALGLKSDESSFKRGEKALDNLKEKVVEIGAAYLGFEGVKAIYELVAGTAELAEQTKHTAQAVGTTTDSVQELGYAARVTGTSTEEMQTGLMHLARSVQGAKDGTGPTADAFRKLGISMNDPAIKGGDTSAVFELLSEKISKMPDGVEKTALSMDILGRSGARLIPLMNKGAGGIASLSEAAKESGNVITGETLEAFEEFKQSTNKLGASIGGLKNIAATKLLPVVERIVEAFSKWLDAHREEIIAKITTAVEMLADAVQWAFDNSESLIETIETIGIAIGAMAAIWLLMAAGPLLIAGAVVALVFLIIKHWDKIKAAAYKVFDSIKGAVKALGRGIRDGLAAAFAFIADLPVIKQLLWLAGKLDKLTGGALSKPGTAMGDTAFDFIHGEAIDHSDENQDQSAEAVAKRKVASDAYYAQHGPAAVMTPGGDTSNATTTTNVTNNVTVNAPSADSATVGKHVADHLDKHYRDTAAATGGQ